MLELEIVIDPSKPSFGEALMIPIERAEYIGFLMKEMLDAGFTVSECLSGISLHVNTVNELAFASVVIGTVIKKSIS